MIHSGSIFIKTATGREEVAHRSGTLSVRQRRLLIMIDSKRTVNDLSAFVRVGDLEPTLEQLIALGLIESEMIDITLPDPAASGFMVANRAEEPRPATSPQEFLKLRQEASQYVAQQLGDEASKPICAAIDQCKNPIALRKMLRGVEIFVGNQLSQAQAQQFARRFGSQLV